MKRFVYKFTILLVLVLISSCTVTESIFFNDDMSGEYCLKYDLSSMMKMTGDMSDEAEQPLPGQMVLDTVIVFNDFLEAKKDSIATLPKEEQLQLENLRGFTLTIHEDHAKEDFSMTISKSFTSVEELQQVNEQVEQALEVALKEGKNAEGPMNGDMNSMNTELNSVTYTFNNNTFVRHQPEAKTNEDDIIEDEDAFDEPMDNEIDKMTNESFYIITYSFPKRIKSISNKNAQLSKDGKAFTLSIPWKEIDKDETLLNLKIELEDK